MRWPLLTIAAGVIMMQFSCWAGVRLTSKWRRAHPAEAQPFRDELGSVFLRKNPVAWLFPVFAFGSLGRVLGGLLWLARS